MIRHCLDCDALVINDSRCRRCARARMRLASAHGRAKRGNNWTRVSAALRQRWRDQGFGCVDAADGKCRGRIQADHLDVPGVYQPRCAYNNNKKH